MLAEANRLKKEYSEKWKRWGWYTILHQIAEGGYFQNGEKTKEEAALDANFLDAMIWLAEKTEMRR
jgi:hypothetical protein